MDAYPVRENPDHEKLSRLAHDDPEAFEALRRQLIATMIDRAPRRLRKRLRGLQFRIDHVRALAHTPLNAAVRISELMWKSFLNLNDELSGRNTRPHRDAQVINLHRKRLPDAG